MRVLLSGVTGQVGAYMADFLLKKGYKVFATFRRASSPNFWRIMTFGIEDKIELIPADLTDITSLIEAIKTSDPDEIYNFAASSYVADSFECPLANIDITGNAVMRFLEATRIVNKDIKFFQMSSSEQYGNSKDFPLNENSPMNPVSPYGIAKLMGHHAINTYRQSYGMFTVAGIIFNTESPLRGLDFVTRKITNAVAKIKLGLQDELVLGNVYAIRDWGLVSEYIEGIAKMMELDEPQDFVLATGESATVLKFAHMATQHVGLDESVIKTDKKYSRPIDINKLQGDYTKANTLLDWAPKTKFNDLVKLMVDADLKRWQDYLDGKHFPWDAYLYPNEAKVLRRINN